MNTNVVYYFQWSGLLSMQRQDSKEKTVPVSMFVILLLQFSHPVFSILQLVTLPQPLKTKVVSITKK